MAKNNALNVAWKNADKGRAVAAYAALGSYLKAERVTGIPQNTIRFWAKQEWFAEELLRAKQADTDELGSTFTRIAKKAASELEDRLEQGDQVVTKEGRVILRKISAKEAAIVAGVAVDKRKVLMEQPVTVAVQSSNEKLVSLMEEFIKFSKAKEIKGEVSAEDTGTPSITVEGEGILEVEQHGDRYVSVAKIGEPQERFNGTDGSRGETGQHDPSGTSEGPGSQILQG